jgi:RND family efflux transporter MFP subunit
MKYMQNKSKLIGSVIALTLVIIAVLYMAGVFSDKQGAGLKNEQQKSYNGPLVEVALQTITRTEHVPGTVIAKQNTQISSRVMAQVERLNVRAGDTVKQGDLLITLQQDDFAAQLAQSDAQINAIQASLTQAKKQLARVDNMFSKNLVSQSELDGAKARFDNLSANLVMANQQQAQVKVSLGFTRITAPISGVVVERLVEPGDMVTPGIPLIALYNPQQLQVEFNVRETQAIKLALGQRLQVSLPALKVSADALVSEIVPVADKAARSLLIRLEIDSQSGLIPGLYAQLQLPLDSEQGILVQPEWIQQFGQLSMVYVLEHGTVARRFVRLGEVIDAKQHVVAGLNSGDKLAINYISANPRRY